MRLSFLGFSLSVLGLVTPCFAKEVQIFNSQQALQKILSESHRQCVASINDISNAASKFPSLKKISNIEIEIFSLIPVEKGVFNSLSEWRDKNFTADKSAIVFGYQETDTAQERLSSIIVNCRYFRFKENQEINHYRVPLKK